MEASKEPISVRISKLNNQLLRKTIDNKNNIDREGLLDALNVLYDECNTDSLKRDKYISNFVDKFKNSMSELRKLRVNISDFEVKNVIGRGHFGIVHVVQEKQTGDIYAMKTLRKADSLNHTTCYEEERDIMALTDSPWLTQLQYAFQDSGHLYLVMEFHPGGDLYGLLERQGGSLSESAAVFYISELVEAIKALHTMGYVHRDVKPDNVLLDRCGHLKLADFGSAAKINSKGIVSDKDVVSIGTSDYIAPEVLQSIDKPKNKVVTYGIACDYWSLGVLAYELTIGTTPFASENLSMTYNKIMNHTKNLKFPNDRSLSENFISLIKGLLCDQNLRLDYKKIVKHPLFKEVDWTTLREQVPPFVPIVNSVDDTSNFLEVESTRSTPSIDNFKSKTQFSGRNLPFIGFTFTNINSDVNNITVIRRSEEEMLRSRKKEVESLQKMLAKAECSSKEYEVLESKYEECSRKLEGVESVRDKLEKDLAAAMADSNALRRTLELERRERKELENKALDLIKSAKQKWEVSEKSRLEKLNEQIEIQNNRITELCTSNNELTSRLERSQKLHEETERELERLKNLQKEHQDSLVKARALSRKSIVGVENRLERISNEAQIQIQELQTKLSASIENANHLQQEIELYRKRERVLEEQITLSNDQIDSYKKQLDTTNAKIKSLERDSAVYKNNVEEVETLRNELHLCQNEIQKLLNENKCARLEEALKHERDEVKSLRKQLKELRTSMNETIMTQDSYVQEKGQQFEKDINRLEDKLRNVTNEKEELRNKLQEALEKENVNKLKVQNLEELLSRLESGVTKLESGSQDSVYESQIKRLEEQIRVLHETTALEKQELRTANTNLWRKEKELSNCELDKRIVERELKTAEEKIKTLTTEIETLKTTIGDQTKTHEDSLKEIQVLNSEMKIEISALQSKISELETNVCSYKEKYESEKECVKKLHDQLLTKADDIEKLNKDLKNEIKMRKMLEKQVDEVRQDNIRLNYNRDMSRRDEDEARRELETCRRELENTQLNINVLKDACKLLEGQLEEYEQLISAHESKEVSLSDKMSELSDEVVSTKTEIQEARQKYNEEKSLRLLSETKCKRLQEDVELLQKECSSYKQQVLDYKELSSQLNEDMTATEERCAELEFSLKQLERQFEGLKNECIAVKEESAKRLTHIHQVRESNYKLNQELTETKEDNSTLMAKIAQLELTLTDQTNYYKQRELKSDATIQQQTKLIDFLQSKIDDQNKKKKTLSDKLFGHSKKENIPPSLALNYKEMESMLMKERESNRNLREEVTKLKALSLPNEKFDLIEKKATPPNSPRTKMALEQLVRSPASQGENFQRKPSIQRMHHNIPHRFESRICIKPSKCVSCSEAFQIGRSISVCKECSITSHTKCIHKIPRTCGLPNAYAKHFTKTLSTSSTSSNSTNLTHLQNWVKIPNNKGWEKKYANLKGDEIQIYEHEPTNIAPIIKIELCPPNGKGKLITEITQKDCGNVAGTDLPFIIRIDMGPNTTCWPQSSQFLMFLNADDKQKWVDAIEKLFKQKYGNDDLCKGTMITKLVNNEQVNCLNEISKEILILGCEEGLYSSRSKTLVHITGVTKIYQMTFIKVANLVLMISGEKRGLYKAELKQLESLAQRAQFTHPNLQIEKVINRDNFLLFEASNFVKNQIICAATSKQLIIIKYDYETLEFKPIRILDTAEPCSCILFNEHSVIVGANKYFEIDLKTFSADEFLDASDPRLAQAYNCYKLGSYPISILLVNKPEYEYLLCFNEFGCFVDEYGRRSRQNDIKWSHLPIAFAFCHPFLFIVQFSAIEIVRINPDPSDNICLDSWECPESVRLEFSKVKYLGANKKGIYVLVKNDVIFLDAKAILGEYEIDEESETSDDGTEFSFTSSQLQSLDRMSSDGESGEKRVHFAHQTDL